MNLRLLTVEEFARSINVSRAKAYMLIRDGQIETVKIDRARRIPVEEIDAYVDRLRTQASQRDGRAAG